MNDTTKTASQSTRFDSATTENERHSLQTYVSDLLALIEHIAVPIDRQVKTEESANYAEALAVITEIKSVTDEQKIALKAQLDALGGHAASGIKSAWSAFLGAGAAAIGSSRKTKVSKNLRDDYTALGLASISYTMLNATALGLGDQATATLAQRSLEQIAPIIMRISRIMPGVVLQELQDDGETVRVSAADVSVSTTQAAWQKN